MEIYRLTEIQLYITFGLVSLSFASREYCDLPEIHRHLSIISVPVGSDAEFSCVLRRGIQNSWEKDGIYLTVAKRVVTSNRRIYLSYRLLQNTSKLLVKNVQEEDRGSYRCSEQGGYGCVQTFYLEVTVPPKIFKSISDVAAPEGLSEVLMRCRASGRPHPEVYWMREDQKKIDKRQNKLKLENSKSDLSVLHLTNITRDDMGHYICIANNSVPPIASKRIMVQVLFPPNVRIPDQVINASLRAEVILKCIVESSSQAMSYWTKFGTILMSRRGDYTIKISNYKNEMTLTIHSFKARNQGIYYCHAKNSIGESEGSMQVLELDWVEKYTTERYEGETKSQLIPYSTKFPAEMSTKKPKWTSQPPSSLGVKLRDFIFNFFMSTVYQLF